MLPFVIQGEFVGLMFDETVQPGFRQTFEGILSKYSVFMAQEGTPTVHECTSIRFCPVGDFFSLCSLVRRVLDSG